MEILVIFNIIMGVTVLTLIAVMVNTYYRYESFFGDDDKRMPLQFRFLRLLVLAILLALVAAVVNILTFF